MISLRSVYKSYGSIKVLENFNFDIADGESVCIVGKSGCGKSTLLKVIALIANADKGDIVIDGRNANELKQAEREELMMKKMAYSFQEPLLIPYMTALENLTEVVGATKERAVEVLSKLGLSNRLNHKPSRLSVGEKKKVDVARAVLRGSPLLIADEPLSNLDPTAGLTVMQLLSTHVKSNRGLLIYSSVEPSDSRFAERVVTM